MRAVRADEIDRVCLSRGRYQSPNSPWWNPPKDSASAIPRVRTVDHANSAVETSGIAPERDSVGLNRRGVVNARVIQEKD